MLLRKTGYLWMPVLLLLLTSTLSAQFTQRSRIDGVVTDPSGAVIPGAGITLTELDRNQTAETATDDEGRYSFNSVTPGRYKVAVEMPGFSRTVSDEITLASQQTLRVDLTLQIGELSQTVEVKGAAPLLKSEQATVGQIVDRTFVESLPTKGRNFTAFVALAPNISTFPRGNSGGTWAVGGHHVIGGLDYVVGGGGNNGFYMNGVNINENWVGGLSYAPSVEAVAEVKVDVAGFSAENGRDISTLNVMTRGGGNEYHGAIYDYLQNDNLNALNAFDKAMGADSAAFLQRNQFGGNFGGPVRIPRLFDGRDKLFFFFNFEATRENRGGENAIYRVPTEDELKGDFSHLLARFPDDPYYVIYNPYSTVINEEGMSIRTPVPNNDLRNVANLINPQAREMLEGLFPRPNGYSNPSDPGDLRNYRSFQSSANNNYRIDARFDYKMTETDNVFVNFSKSHGLDDNRGGLFPFLNPNLEDSSQLITANYAKAVSPTLTNEFIFAIGRGRMYNVDQKSIDYMRQADTLRNKYFQNLGVGDNFGLYAMEIADIATLGSWETFMASNPTLQFSDNVNWIRGRHSVKTGFNYFRKEESDWDVWRGVYFDNQFTRAGSVDDSIGGDSLASFLVGIPSYMRQKYQLTGGEDSLRFQMPYWGLFVEDKFQATSKLTVSAGLRYDLSIPIFSPIKYGNAIIDFDYPGWQMAIPGRAPGLDLHYLPLDKNNFAPRISLAYRPKSDLIIRTSYGVFYDLGTSNVGGETRMGSSFDSVPGYVGSDYANWSVGVHDDEPYFSFSDVFPEALTFPVGNYPISTGSGTGYFEWMASPRFADKESEVTPLYHRYMAEIQKGLGSQMVVAVSYFGGRGMKLPYYLSLNQPAYQTGWASEDAFNEARPNNNGRFGDAWVLRHGLNSFYNAATLKVERRMSSGLQFVSHYTFSKTVQDRDYRYHRGLGRGEANFSHPHRFFSALTWDVPWGKTLPAAARYLLSDWRLSLMTTFESGNAETVWNEATSARDMEPDRPNLSGDPNLSGEDRTMLRYFDTGVFSAPPQDVKGNAGEGIVRGPGVNNWDMSLGKTFRITEDVNADLRGEFFNLFNHTQWGGINTGYDGRSNSQFGQVTWGREPRIIQLGLKIYF